MGGGRHYSFARSSFLPLEGKRTAKNVMADWGGWLQGTAMKFGGASSPGSVIPVRCHCSCRRRPSSLQKEALLDFGENLRR